MREQGWEKRLAATVEQYRRAPFAWGTSDCVIFAADCAKALTGADPAVDYRGKYSDAAGAVAIVKSFGGENVGDAAGHFFEAHPTAHAHARRGDIAMVAAPTPEDPLGALGVILGNIVAVYGPKGLHFVSRKMVIRSFRVG